MKKITLLCCVLCMLLVWGCNGGNKGNAPMADFPAPGTIIDSASMPILSDSLNDFDFFVNITADSSVKSGVYDVYAAYGNNIANGSFTMPKGGEHYRPALKKGAAPYTFIIGFYAPKDTTFYDYFEVTGTHNTIGMKYIKAYTFE